MFLGASYFRAVGRDEVYGLSARGIAIDTALSSGEEFPWFREFWLVQPGGGAQELTFYALLDSPSTTGAYRFVVAPGAADAARRRGAPLRALGGRQARHRAAHQHVLPRRRRRRTDRLPARGPRL